jgi:exopolyphosphatase/pppGpp-phosphohydrolase
LAALGVEEGRRDTILHGALVFDALLEQCGANGALVSAHGLREGVALRALGHVRRRAPARRVAV